MEQIATFFTHLGALRFQRRVRELGDKQAVMAPVPRKLSASCGTCVRFSIPFQQAWAEEDLEAVYRCEDGGYAMCFRSRE
jgi:hypothetical protein